MDDRPKKWRGPLLWLAGRSRRFRIVAAALLPMLYVASYGPVFWLYDRTGYGDRILDLYRPLLRLVESSDDCRHLFEKYAFLGSDGSAQIVIFGARAWYQTPIGNGGVSISDERPRSRQR